MISQTLEGRYVDKEKLVKLLKALFGVGNFSIKVRGSWSLRENFQCPILTDLFHGRTWMTASNFQCLGSLPKYVIKPNSDKISRRVWELLTVDLFQKNEQAQSKPD